MSHKKILVALSGGVDRSTSAALLLQSGYVTEAVYMVTCDHGLEGQAEAQRIADRLGMTLHVLDLRTEFQAMLRYVLDEYRQGRTPNPCVRCNRQIKFGMLWDLAQAHGAGLLATGHYAQVLDTQGGPGLFEANDKVKDQSYVLSMIDRTMLNRVVFPMGRLSKDRTRQIAMELDLALEDKPESQEICFIPNDDYVAALEQLCPELIRPGPIIDSHGKVIGLHHGIHRYTIGQRRGLGVAMGKPWYVVRLDAATNAVVLGPREEVLHKGLVASGVNWLVDPPSSPFRARAKIRYNDKGRPAEVRPNGNSVTICFDEPAPAITPGQLAVFYTLDPHPAQVLGGAWIDAPND